MSENNKFKKLFSTKNIFLFSFIVIIVLSVVGYCIEKYKKNHFNENVIAISDYIFSHNFEKRTSIELDDFSVNSDARKAFKQTEFISIELIDNHTVLITTEVLFHSVKGILVTDGTEINDFEIIIPDSDFDGNRISASSTDIERIYTWHAGL
ncbi:MAG: hypothetical protein E7497_07810 [Ruminococcus sp.]|nr:hypothetical protein [Ruminococcus sp.]